MIWNILKMLWVIWVTILCMQYCSYTHIRCAEAQELEYLYLQEFGYFVEPRPARTVVTEEYTIVAGDTLGKIASRFGTTWEALWQLNRDRIADPNVVHVGQKIRIRSKAVKPVIQLTREQKVKKLVKFMYEKSGYATPFCHTKAELGTEIATYQQAMHTAELTTLDTQRLWANRIVGLTREYEFWLLAEAIVDQAKNEDEFYRLVGLAWQETHFLNVRGKKGEVTVYQFLPSTLKWYVKTDDIGVRILMDDLCNSPSKATALALEMLRANKWNWSWWNHGLDYQYHINNKIYWFKHWWIGR